MLASQPYIHAKNLHTDVHSSIIDDSPETLKKKKHPMAINSRMITKYDTPVIEYCSAIPRNGT